MKSDYLTSKPAFYVLFVFSLPIIIPAVLHDGRFGGRGAVCGRAGSGRGRRVVFAYGCFYLRGDWRRCRLFGDCEQVFWCAQFFCDEDCGQYCIFDVSGTQCFSWRGGNCNKPSASCAFKDSFRRAGHGSCLSADLFSGPAVFVHVQRDFLDVQCDWKFADSACISDFFFSSECRAGLSVCSGV